MGFILGFHFTNGDNEGGLDDLGGRSSNVFMYGDGDVGLEWRSSIKVNFGDCGDVGGRSSNISICKGGDVGGV